jgi:hypothetical protein
LLERGYGKVPDKLEGGDPANPVRIEHGLSELTVEELRKLAMSGTL